MAKRSRCIHRVDILPARTSQGSRGGVWLSCYAKPAKKPTDKTRWTRYVPLSSVQSLYDCRAEIIVTYTPSTSDACPIRREVYCQSSPSTLLIRAQFQR